VPHVVLIDTHGKIAYAGHPATRKLEDDIETLIKGEKLTGDGVAAGSSEEGGETDDDLKTQGFSDLDMSKVDKELNDFLTSAPNLAADAGVKSAATSLKRDMVVLVKLAKYDGAKDKFLTKF